MMEMEPRRQNSCAYDVPMVHDAEPNVNNNNPIQVVERPENPSACSWILIIVSYILLACTFPFSILLCLKVVQQYQGAVVFRLGKVRTDEEAGPGLLFILPCVDDYVVVDKRVISFDVPQQEVLTRDSVTITVDAVTFFRIDNSVESVCKIKNACESTKLLAMTTLRNELGTKNLMDILVAREATSRGVQRVLDAATDPWGVKVERVEIKDVHLPAMLQRAMAAEAEASREARAKVITAEGEMNASRWLKEASEVISESPQALQLRYLQTLQAISAVNSSTIVFPVPMDILPQAMSMRRN